MGGRVPLAVGAVAAATALIIGIVFGTYVAGGSDSSCYLNAGRLLARGAVRLEQPLVRDAPWANAERTFTPAGFTPSRADPAFFVPICSPGLPLAMALFRVLRLNEFLVVPLLGALGVWLTYVIGCRVHSPATGAAAALLVVCSPTFLYQVVQPMSDVPAMAWWLLAIAWVIEREDGSNRPWLAGLATSLALLTRPNLVLLSIGLAAYLLATAGPGRRVRAVARFGAGLAPGLLMLAMLQRGMYGSPLSTGYGDVEGMMAASHVVPNLIRYAGWLGGTHGPFLLLALAAPAVVARRRHAWLCLGISAATLASYLPYLVFDAWWYTRFLLPAIPLLILLSVTTLVALIERLVARAPVALAVCTAVVMAAWVNVARERRAFEVASLEQHFYRAGMAVATYLPEAGAIVTAKASGSVQYHAGVAIVSWDTLDPGSLDQALAYLRRGDSPVYLLLEGEEEPAFRDRFSRTSLVGHLDWPPLVQVGRTIRIYDPLDRARYLADGTVRTRFVQEAPVPFRDWRRWLRSSGG